MGHFGDSEFDAGRLETQETGKPKRGFARLSKEERTELARKAGTASHAKGTAHEWTSEKAREAGRKGGLISAERRKASKS